MGHNHGVGVLGLEAHDGVDRELLMHVAAAVPEQHLATGDAVDIVAQIVVGAEDNLLVLWEGVYHLLGIAAGHHTVGERLDGSRGVDIRHHLIARMLVLELLQVFCLATVGERAASREVGAYHCLFGREQFPSLCHKVYATHHHHLGIGLCRLARQSQRVAHKVGYLLYLAYCIIMCQDDGILLLTHAAYLLFEIQTLLDGFVYATLVNPLFVHHHYYIFYLYLISLFLNYN